MSTPQTIKQYLAQLRAALAGADPAMIQDALYDAEEHLRSELAENPGMSEAELLAKIATSYGAPDEVAEIYRTTEQTVARALRRPPPRPRRSAIGRFFGVIADPHTYGAMFYMLLALATGIFYFTWTVAGLSMSIGFAFTLIGIPFFLLFMASARGLSLLESRIVEGMLGVRMPRRPPYVERERPWLKRIGSMLADPRTWFTLLYMILMLPLG
ncbi:MAG: sensor domain-containing protein, partial [Rhodanobacteraceae bacterium]